jgi:hypothetical protein
MHTDIAAVAANRSDELLAFADAIVRANEVGKLDLFREVLNREAAKLAAPTIARKSAPKGRKAIVKAPAMAPNWAGTMMKAQPGTTSSGQRRWLTEKGFTVNQIATMSMVEASNLRHAAKNVTPIAPVSAIDWDTDGRDDSGYAEGDTTSRWIERIERNHV